MYGNLQKQLEISILNKVSPHAKKLDCHKKAHATLKNYIYITL